jgi:ubiquinone/menaquinone biosynthesis C-methylase UbiE
MSTPAKRPSDARSKAAAAYDPIAAFYDPHWGLDFLEGALTMHARWLAPRLPASGARVLDVCCGSGEFAAWLAKSQQVTGIDLSNAMLEIARNKAPQVCFKQEDMRTFRLAERDFDAAVCFYNSLNQAMTPKALRAAIASVAWHIRPGGWFLFDFIDESAFLSTWEFEETALARGQSCHLRYRYNPKTRIATCRARIDGDEWTVLRQRPIEEAEIREALQAAGFRVEAIAPVANVNPSRGRSAVLAQLSD